MVQLMLRTGVTAQSEPRWSFLEHHVQTRSAEWAAYARMVDAHLGGPTVGGAGRAQPC